AEWYRTRDYNFLALSDHNVLAEGVRYMDHAAIVKRGGTAVMEKYLARFGKHWVETRGEPGNKDYQIRLKPLNEFRSLIEERGKFLLMSSEEISDSVNRKPLHLNATNLKEVIRPQGGTTIRDAIEANLRAVADQAKRTGREVMVHLNHPNFGYAVTAEDLAAALSERFVEVYNGHPGVRHLGDADHPSVEQIWDVANTIRLARFRDPPLFGLATDDSHHYHGKPTGSRPGRGWIMVRARRLTPESLIRAIKQGDFYASSGVTIESVEFNAKTRELSLTIAGDDGATFETEFIGASLEEAKSSKKITAEIGKVFKKEKGLHPSYRLTGKELYVRATVTSSRPHPNPSFKNQRMQAWTQPVGWRARLDADDKRSSDSAGSAKSQ
ncbi:MAG: hypothetical protein N2C14_05070, partial [Planctomycetales bacterium]